MDTSVLQTERSEFANTLVSVGEKGQGKEKTRIGENGQLSNR